MILDTILERVDSPSDNDGKKGRQTLKLLHTADWQIGMKAESLGEAAEIARKSRLRAAERVLDLVKQLDVDYLLIAGDIFEHNAVDRRLVNQVGELLRTSPVPVLIIPGNHDPWVPGSVWEHPVWKAGAQAPITVFSDSKPWEDDGLIVYPCPLREKYSHRDPTAWIEQHYADRAEKVAIGLAHGNVEGLPNSEPDFPIPRNAAERLDLDYLALGHWHSFSTYPNAKDDGNVRMAYSGTHETSKFGERESGFVVLVELPSKDQPPTLTPHRSGSLEWRHEELSLGPSTSLADLVQRFESQSLEDRVLLRLRLDGLLMPEDVRHLDRLRELITSRFAYGRLETQSLRPAPEGDRWIDSLPAGPLREAGRRLRDQAASEDSEDVRTVALHALLELFDLAQHQQDPPFQSDQLK